MPDLHAQCDEELVRLAQADHAHPAVHVLALRYHHLAIGWLERQRWPAWLPREDLRDAQQEVFFSLLKAIDDFGRCRAEKPLTCNFRTVFRRHLSGDHQNLICALSRQHGQQRRLTNPAGPLGPVSQPLPERLAGELPRRAATDPAEAAEWQELLDHLGQALDRLSVRQRWLVQRRSEGTPLSVLARQLGQPYHCLIYLWKTALVELGAGLRE